MDSIRLEATRTRSSLTLALAIAALALLSLHSFVLAASAATVVQVVEEPGGLKLAVDGEDFMVFGMNWGYMPIGENYNYNLWSFPDDFIEEVLAREMPLLKAMGVNAIRQYAGIPTRWVQYIYEKYGIYTMVNHLVARYGYTLDGVWIPTEQVDYSNPRLREVLVEENIEMARTYTGTPGVLMWLLGNENNYGLHWSSSEIEALPEDERNAAKAVFLYSLFEEITVAIKKVDSNAPVAICNGDLQYIDIIARECKSMDVLGTNVYRGISARDLYQVVNDKLGVPVVYTEFGADAWNAKDMREDQTNQARWLLGQWQEIYEMSAGKGRVGNAIGGFIFQWSDGWWKYKQTERLDIHDTNASWPNGGYPDYVEGENNMNEEWWGITAKGPRDHLGFYPVYPRAAYYVLMDAFRLDPYAPGTDLDAIRSHFGAIEPIVAVHKAGNDEARRVADSSRRASITGVRAEFETFSTDGTNITTPPSEAPRFGLPSYLGFGNQQSFYVNFQVSPAENLKANLSVNILGNIAANQIDEIFYENRGIDAELQAIDRVRAYTADVSWDDRWFRMDGFYRTGHYHWGYEGDFFGIYREAYYGENIDIYNSDAPIGVELTGKRHFKDFKLAFGPQLWWGANPALFLKYQHDFGRTEVAALFQEEFAQQTEVSASSAAQPVPATRRASVFVETSRWPVGIEIGGIWAGSTKEGDGFKIYEGTEDNYKILQDYIVASDALGAKAKLTYESGRWHWYAQGAYQGLVADGGPTATRTFTGWTLKDSNAGNQSNFITGLAVNIGKFQVAPNFLWQKPIVGPIPGFVEAPGRPRNAEDDPFIVRANRETTAGELMITYDPTPATWLWDWDNDVREDARLAWSLGFVFRHQPTTQDVSLFFPGPDDAFTGWTPLPGAPPPKDLWEVRTRVVSKLGQNKRLAANLYFGNAEPNAWTYRNPDPMINRFIERLGLDARLTWNRISFETFAKFNDWGPYDYHRDWNFTFPVHLMGDLSYTLGAPRWFGDPQTKLGIRGTWRSLDQYSNRYDAPASGEDGTEWEIRTYVHIAL